MRRYIQKVLVPVDGSESSRKALEMAVAIAQAAQARLTVLEVIEEFGPLPGYYEAPPPGKDRADWIAEQRFEKVHPVLEELGAAWERRVEEGDPADQICRVAEEGRHDLIVIGHRGRSEVARFLLGSVSGRVVQHAPCSVVVVK